MATANPARTREEIAPRHASILDYPLRIAPVRNLAGEHSDLLEPPSKTVRSAGTE